MCLTSDDLMRMGYMPSEQYAVPETYSRTWDFYVVNGYYHDTFDYDEIYSIVMNAAESGENAVYMKFSDADSYAAAVDMVLPVCHDALFTINIFW